MVGSSGMMTRHVTKPELRSWQGLYRIWFDVQATLQYYPLLHSVFWVEHKLWGDATLGYHLINLLLHAAAAVMVALILRRLTVPGAYLAAAIFALHPVHVESVAWITEQKNTLSAVFYLGAMLVYLHFDQTRKIALYWWALGLFVLAILSKTVTATLPGGLLVIFWWQRGRLSWKRDVLPLMPLFLLGAGGGMVTAWWEVNLNRCVGPDYDLTLVERFLIAGRAVWFYLWKLLWPTKLTFIYPRWQIDSAQWWQYVFLLGAAALLAALWAMRRWRRAPLVALLFFAGTLFPVLGFFNLYASRYSFVANHYQYLASLGIITFVSAGIVLLLDRWRLSSRPAGYLLCLMLLAALATLTWRQSRMYADIETLYQTTIDENPACWMAHNNLGKPLAARGRRDEAMDHYRKALELKPDSELIHNNLGNALADRGQVDSAIVHYQKALEIQPDYAEAHKNLGNALARRGQVDSAIVHYQKALEIQPDFAEAHNNLGNALADRGQVDSAITHYQKALEIKPDFAEAHFNFGVALASRRQVDEAMACFRKALEIKPDYAEAHNNLGNALAGRGQVDSAIAHYQKALEIKPDYAKAHFNLGNALAGRGQVDSAIVHYQKALEIKPDYAEAHNNLGNALADRGQVDSAIAHYQRALKIKPDYAEAHHNLGTILAGRGEVDLAIAHYQKALEIKPDYAKAHRNLAIVLAERERILKTLAKRREAMRLQPNDAAFLNDTAWMLATNPNASVRNGTEAVELAERALKLSGGNEPAILGTLAAAQAEAGRFPEAAATARKALELARQQNRQALADTLRARIALYEAGKPYHEASPVSASDGKADRGTVSSNAGKRQPMARPAKEPSKNIPPSAKAPRR